jgi:hypothetical protein
MTRRREIDLEVQSTAGVAAVFALLADGTTWPRWSPLESVELERTGEPPPEGVGAIRVNRRGRTTGRDQIVEVVPGCRFAYVSLSGVPVRDYKAAVDLEPAATGSVIRWRASFLPKVPGTGLLMQLGIRRFLDRCARGLAQYAAAPAAGVTT